MRTIKSFLAILGTLFLFSCTMNVETTFHKDNTFSILMNIDAKELMGMVKESPDAGTFKMNEYFGKDWKSLYDIAEEAGEPIPADSVEAVSFAKKTFLKGLFTEGEATGFAFEMKRVTDKEFELFSKDKSTKEVAPFVDEISGWNGKQLVLNLENIVHKNRKKNNNEEGDEMEAIVSEIMNQVDIQMNTTYRFENKIKSIQGKHPFFKKIDDYTVQLNVKLNSEEALAKGDKKIIITVSK